MADQVLLKIVCLLMRWFFNLAVLVVRGDRAKNAELLVLRHENAVLRRNAGRIRYDLADRAWFAVLMRFLPRRRWAEVFPVEPATLLAWHRRLAARKYDTSKRRKPGRPPALPRLSLVGGGAGVVGSLGTRRWQRDRLPGRRLADCDCP